MADGTQPRPAQATPARPASTPDPSAAAICVRDFNLWYGDFQALFDVNLQVTRGKVTSLIGPSGCGKSTLLRSINRINERLGYVRTSGAIELLGQDILAEGVELTPLRRSVGMVFQRPNPLPLSIRDNVLFAYRLSKGGKTKRADEDQVLQEALEEVLLWDQVKDRLKSSATALSLEEQQKLCIARLLPVKPSVLLMDEPTSAQDVRHALELHEILGRLRARGAAILVCLHDLSEVLAIADQAVLLECGSVHASGPAAEIVQDRHITPVYGVELIQGGGLGFRLTAGGEE